MASLTPISGTLGVQNAAHFLRRTTFGPTRTAIDEFATKTITQAIADVMQPLAAPPDPPLDPATGSDWLPKPDDLINSSDESLFEYFKGWFMELMRTSGMTITEKMTFFWHAFLPADNTLIRNSTSLYYQNALYRHYALGNLRDLMKKVCVDNAMLVYIDNTLNDRSNPNENFARELMELYTIGKGPQIGPEDYTNYTETDVKQAARVLTGIKHNFNFDTIDPDTSLPRGKVTLDGLAASRHDAGLKVFTDKFNNTEIAPDPTMMVDGMATEEGFYDELSHFIDMIYAQEETSKFFCRKLYRYFVYYKITDEIEQDIIIPLATTLRDNDFEVQPVLEQLLASEHFFDVNNSASTENNIGALIKSPMELTVGAFRFFNIAMPTDITDLYEVVYSQSISRMLANQGIDFYTPIDVAGYPPYHQVPAYNRNWISPNSLAQRYNLSNNLVDGKENESGTMLYQLDIVAYVEDTANISDASDPTILIKELTDYMFTQTIPQERFDYFLNDVFHEGLDPNDWTVEWNQYLATGVDTEIRIYLERLLHAIIQTPEYQLF
jgi:uncharacterized protein (DUF1800 family)